MIKRFPIRSKLAAALAVPLLLLVSVAYVEVSKASDNVEDVREEAELAVTTVGPGGITLAVQNERNLSATDLLGQAETMNLTVKTVPEARKQTDLKLAEFRKVLAEGPETTEALYGEAFAKLTDLEEVRAQFDGFKGERVITNFQISTDVFQAYTQIIEAVLDANAKVPLLINDAELRTAAQMLDQVSRMTNNIGRLTRAIVFSVLTNDTSPQTIAEVNGMTAKYDLYLAGFEVYQQDGYSDTVERFNANPRYKEYRGMVQEFQDGNRGIDIIKLLSLPTQIEGNNNFDFLRRDTVAFVENRADKLVSDAEEQQRNFTMLAIFGLLAAILVTGLAARSITRPLRQLTRQTEDMASRRLPEAVQEILDTPVGQDVQVPELAPIRVRTRDEVADVAAALSTVQTRTLDLAVEQAVLRRNIADSFVNLGRRTQNLISRQLDFITTLEQEEQDPEALEDLFKLDHLATRVRRNAESLVVLAGLETSQQWSAPIEVGDVVRAALGEVEEYQRVEITEIEPAKVPGASASDLVHLMAELIENGLSFSPPDRPVEVLGRMTDKGYLLAIIDQGIGMSAEELDRANQRLAGEESFTIAPSRYLGHYVTGHLAARTGVDVALQPSPAGGVTAKIVIPIEALAVEELAADEAPAAGLNLVEDVEVEESVVEEARPVRSDGPPPAAPAPVPAEAAPEVEVEPEPEPEPQVAAEPEPQVAAEPEVEAPAPVMALHTGNGNGNGDIALKKSTTKTTTKAKSTGNGSTAAAAPAPVAKTTPTTGGVTANGLSKRVKGVQMPNTTGVIASRKAEKPAAAPAISESAGADTVFDFLSSFDSGMKKGREDAQQTDDTDPTTDTNKNEG